MQVLGLGSSGPAVQQVQQVLHGLGLLGERSAAFDGATELAVRTFQQQRGVIVDGLVGPETFHALTAARFRLGDRLLRYSVSAPMTGDDVLELQTRLLEMGYDAGRADGIFHARTAAGLAQFQHEVGLAADGTCGPATLRILHRLGRKVIGGRPQLMRETEQLHRSGPALMGKRIVIDPGHGGDDAGHESGGLREADLAWSLATRFEGRLAAVGVRVDLTRGPSTGPSAAERAAFANRSGADLLVSLHGDANPSPAASGLATFHYGTDEGASSTVGERLGGLMHREILARTPLVDCRVHAKTWDLLRLTSMPAVWLEVGYLSSPADRSLLTSTEFFDVVAEALLVAVQRVFLTGDIDPPTGTLHILPA